MTWISAVVVAVTFLISMVLTAMVRRIAERRGLLDMPNSRSSHVKPTPRGGGVAIVVGISAAVSVLWYLEEISSTLGVVLTIGAIPIAIIGYLDDVGRVSIRSRFLVHVGAGCFAVAWMGGLPPLPVGNCTFDLGLAGYGIALLTVIWTLNLFNFMDGIDGLAGSEGAFVLAGAGAIALTMGFRELTSAAAFAGAAACCGFLVWNWPPAKIFMGDVGSGYLGYFIAVLALSAGHQEPSLLWSYLILGGLFFVDATVTLFRRLIRGVRIHEAHASHAYQHLARRWQSHKRTTLAALAVNLLWLWPVALMAAKYPQSGVTLAFVGLAPLVIVAWRLGAGLSSAEVSSNSSQ